MVGHSFVTTPTSAVVYRLKGYAITTAKLCWTLVCEALSGFAREYGILGFYSRTDYHTMVMAIFLLLRYSLQKITKLERETFKYSREKIENQSSTFNLSFDWNVFKEFIACPKSYVT